MNNILDILEKTAVEYPDKTIFEDENEKIIYSDFVTEAKKAGTAILEIYNENCGVPVFMDKSVKTLIVMFGAVYAGCFYTIIDISHPLSRIESILDTLENHKILTTGEYAEKLEKKGYTGEYVLIEDTILNNKNINEKRLEKVRKAHLDINPLYCNFTSGSTGVPKGVLVGHRSVIDFISNFTRIFNIGSEDIIGNQAPFDFDVSVKDIYSTIFTGAKMIIIPKRKFSFPMELMDYLCEREITTLIWAVSALCIISTLKGFTYKVPQKVNKVIFSGEVMPVKQLKIWKEYLPDAMYVNVYGPTEITCNCTYYVIEGDVDEDTVIPVGRPFPNEKVFLLDENDNPVSDKNISGEICVSGSCLALGYYNNKEQTDRAFVQNPLNKKCREIIYKTGDLGYYNEDGLLCYKGRIDFQIKHMGHRIELLEIEKAVEKLDGIERVCCIFNKQSNNIEAYYKGISDKRQIKKGLRDKLPAYMIPSKLYMVDEFPLTKNGKIDRQKLVETEMVK